MLMDMLTAVRVLNLRAPFPGPGWRGRAVVLLLRDTCLLGDLRPLLCFRLDELGVFVGREAAELVSMVQEKVARLCRFQSFRDDFVHARNDGPGRAGRREHAVPVIAFEAFQSL